MVIKKWQGPASTQYACANTQLLAELTTQIARIPNTINQWYDVCAKETGWEPVTTG